MNSLINASQFYSPQINLEIKVCSYVIIACM